MTAIAALVADGQVHLAADTAGLAGLHVHTVTEDGAIITSKTPYTAAGCGRDLALGSLHATEDLIADPRRRLEMALGAAAQFNAGVRAPFTYVCSTAPGPAS